MNMSTSQVFELIEPADPDRIQRTSSKSEFLLNWLKGGYDEDQGAALRQNNKIHVISGPYQPEDQTAITHQIRIRVLTR